MELAPQLFFAKVMHKRLLPRINGFTYKVYYIAAPLSSLSAIADGWRFALNTFGLMSFYSRDHGPRSGANLEPWIRQLLLEYNIDQADGEVVLVALPRILGYGFNPVSFWLCLDKDEQLRAVLCEVHNTFREQHSYLCTREDRQPITGEDWLVSEKQFHVSPFLKREGTYRFRFDYRPLDRKLGVWIDYYNAQTQKQLLTSLVGHLMPLTRQNRRRAFWQFPLVSLKVIGLIHWQALKLLSKRIRYIPKPQQLEQTISYGGNLTKKLGDGQLLATEESLGSQKD